MFYFLLVWQKASLEYTHHTHSILFSAEFSSRLAHATRLVSLNFSTAFRMLRKGWRALLNSFEREIADGTFCGIHFVIIKYAFFFYKWKNLHIYPLTLSLYVARPRGSQKVIKYTYSAHSLFKEYTRVFLNEQIRQGWKF